MLPALVAFLCGAAAGAQEVEDGGLGEGLGIPDPAEKVLLLRIEGEIGPGLTRGVIRSLEAWRDKERTIAYVIFEFDTLGGNAEAAIELAHFIAEKLKGLRRIAWIPEGKKAISAGTLIAFAADEIVMGPGAQIGDVAPVHPYTGEMLEEKFQTRIREVLTRYARDRGYPTLLTKAMVSKAPDHILRLKMQDAGDAGRVKVRFEYQDRYDRLTAAEKARVLEKEVILHRGELLTMDAIRARDFGFIEHVVIDRNDLLNQLGIHVGDENVIDSEFGTLKSPLGDVQAIIDFFNLPFVRFLLILGGCLGLLLELKMLGTMVPGTIGLGCFLVFFISSSFPVTGSPEGTATLFEVGLFGVGLALIVVEFFLMPGVAIFALAGAALCASSLVLSMVPGGGAQSATQMGWGDAISVLISGFGVGSISFMALLKILPRTRVIGHGGLINESAIRGVPDAESALESQARHAELLGQTGKVETTLRPAGKIVLEDGKVLDVVAEGQFIERGEEVVIVQCTATRVVVAPVDGSDKRV